jgi:hypothetical protein
MTPRSLCSACGRLEPAREWSRERGKGSRVRLWPCSYPPPSISRSFATRLHLDRRGEHHAGAPGESSPQAPCLCPSVIWENRCPIIRPELGVSDRWAAISIDARCSPGLGECSRRIYTRQPRLRSFLINMLDAMVVMVYSACSRTHSRPGGRVTRYGSREEEELYLDPCGLSLPVPCSL